MVRWCEEVRLCLVSGGFMSREPVRRCRSAGAAPASSSALSSAAGAASSSASMLRSASCFSWSRPSSRLAERECPCGSSRLAERGTRRAFSSSECCRARGSSWIVFESFRRCRDAVRTREVATGACESCDCCDSVRCSRVPDATPMLTAPSQSIGVVVAELIPDDIPVLNPLALSVDGSSSNTVKEDNDNGFYSDSAKK